MFKHPTCALPVSSLASKSIGDQKLTATDLIKTSDSSRELRAQVLALRKALMQTSAAAAKVYTAKGIKAQQAAHSAYVASFSSEERDLVVSHVRSTRHCELTDFFEVIAKYGTSVISELQELGRIP